MLNTTLRLTSGIAATALVACMGLTSVAHAETAIAEHTGTHRMYMGSGRTLEQAKRAALDACAWPDRESCRIVWVCEQRGYIALTRHETSTQHVWGASCGHESRAQADHEAVQRCNAEAGRNGACPYPLEEWFEEGNENTRAAIAVEAEKTSEQCREVCGGVCDSDIRACMCFERCDESGVDSIPPGLLPRRD